MMSSQQPQPNMGHRHSLTIETNPLHLLPSNVRRFHRHSLTIETNPLHLLPSNVRRFSQADQFKPGHVKQEILAKIAQTSGIPENRDDEKKEDTDDAK